MKITAQDVQFVNWEKIGEYMREETAKKIIAVSEEAMAALKDLKPGQRKTFKINIGSITISKPKE